MPEQWLARSLAQYQARDCQASLDSSLQALRLRPDYAEAFNNICAANNAMGRYAEAATARERALDLKANSPLAQ